MSDETRRDAGLDEERLADQVADLADRIARGDAIDLGSFDTTHPSGSEALERLLPAIRWLSELGDDEPAGDDPAWFARPADVLGDFRIGREIGRGGIGVVYEATQRSLGRLVALKVLPPSSRLDPRQLRRFETEAQAAAALQHPNIVPVFAYGNESGVPYLAMRLIGGRNLAEVVRELRERNGSGLLPRQAAELARQAAEALDYAHRHDVLHRDIKPSNFLVDEDHRLWVADFGLARVRGDSDLTASGDVLGTLRYLSPEQARGRRGIVDGRSDVYALGATLYELLTLRPVFEGDDRADILIRIAWEEPRFSRRLDAAIPLDLKTIVLKALAKDPAERYATAGELAGDLALFLADQPIRARPPTVVARATRWAMRHWKAMAAAGLMTALLLVGLVAASLWSNTRLRAINRRLGEAIERADRLAYEARAQARLSERHAMGAQLRLAAQALDAGQVEQAQAILRDIRIDGSREAPQSFVWRYLWRRACRDIVVLFGPTPRFVGMALSPDGTVLATTDDLRGVELWDAGTGGGIRAVDAGGGRYGNPAFSLDGSLVAAAERTDDVAAPDGFSIWDVASGRRWARLPMGRGFDGLFAGFLPGRIFLGHGRRFKSLPSDLTRLWSLADDSTHPRLLQQLEVPPNPAPSWTGSEFLTYTNDDPSTVVLRDALTAEPVRAFRLGCADSEITAWACSPGADVVAAASRPGWQVTLWDGHTGKRLASHPVPAGVHQLCVSPDRATLAAVDGNHDIHLIELASGRIRRLVSRRGDGQGTALIAFSRDGTRLATALSLTPRGDDPAAVSIWETATGRRLATFLGRTEELRQLIFTPDGKSLLIASRSGVRRWRLKPGGADGDPQPVGHKDEAWSVAFSPDGRTLATGSDDSEPDPTIKLWDPATCRLTVAWPGGSGTVASLAFSPDGRLLASGHLSRGGSVRIWDPAAGRLIATLGGHTDRVRAVAFARDGRCLASASSDGTVRLWDVASWRERTVLRGHADAVHAIAFSPDGRTLASAGNDGDIRLWALQSGDGSSPLARVLHNRTNLMAIAYSPAGATLAAADTLGSITIWDLDRSTPIRSIHSDGDELRQLAFTLDGKVLAAAGMRGVIRLWDPATGQELISLPSHRAQINGLAFSPDGQTLASASHDGAVKLWRAEPIEPAPARSFGDRW